MDPYKEQNIVIYAKNLCKVYRNGTPLIQDFSMNVEKGTIYGFLGASGCGKTTVLSCIVGILKWNSGKLLVFGKPPGTNESVTSVKRVGYMPQDLALCDLLSIGETLQFYGRIYNMSRSEILIQLNKLTKLLELPDNSKYIQDLSGGEKRRISLALALIHSPELLVLDEPTVGLDPVLRKKIWDHLFELVRTFHSTIIITTHYTEEARFVDRVGFLRNGRMLVEGSPARLVEIHECELLEQVVLKLCRNDDSKEKGEIQNDSTDVTNLNWREQALHPALGEISKNESEKTKNHQFLARVRHSQQRIYGLTSVILKILTRYPLFFILVALIPVSKAVFSIIVFGKMPYGIILGVVNHEVKNWTRECHLEKYSESFCELDLISCKFLNELTLNDSIQLEPYSTEIDALSQVESGRLKGYLIISDNYSEHVTDLAAAKRFALNDTIEGSRIHVRLDQSEYITAAYAIQHIINSFFGYTRKLTLSCEMGVQKSDTAYLNFREPVYGSNNDDYTNFMVPGLTLIGYLALSSGLTAVLLIYDKKLGIFNRELVAGIKVTDLLCSHLLAQTIIVGIQTVILGAALKLVFGYTILGPLWLCWIICLLTGLLGTLLGILMGMICSDEVEVLMLEILAYPILCFETVWSVEYMMDICKYIRYVITIPILTESLRSVIIRGLGMTHPMVWPGIIVIIGWIVVSTVACMVVYRIFRNQGFASWH